MFEIVDKKHLNQAVTQMDIQAPLVAAKAKAGQFIILRVDADGERIPLTIAGFDRQRGTVRILFQKVGATTQKLDRKKIGDSLADFAGPLGNPTELNGLKRVCVVGGGVGCAIALPVARALKENGCEVTSVIGFRTKDLVILEKEFSDVSDRLVAVTDDGTYGEAGNVCVPLQRVLEGGESFDRIFAIGPLVMMKFVAATSRRFQIPCTVSMNPIMIDGTGMCGCCRLSLIRPDGQREMHFACTDGPDFDGWQVDFDEAISRLKMYRDFENAAREEDCRLMRKGVEA